MYSSWNSQLNKGGEEDQSLFEILGVYEDASEQEIKEAYRTLAKIYHPDRASSEDDASSFLLIKQAYEILSDPDQRQVYESCHNNPEFHFRRNRYDARTATQLVDEMKRKEGLTEDTLNPFAVCLTCESCGAPSYFECFVCQMHTCYFCSVKPHCKDGVKPHFPVHDNGQFGFKMAKAARERKEKKKNEAPKWFRSPTTFEQQRQHFLQLSKQRAEDSSAAAELQQCYCWAQTPELVFFAVWAPGEVHQMDVQLLQQNKISIDVKSRPTAASARAGAGIQKTPVINRCFAGEIAQDRPLQSITAGTMHVAAFVLHKKKNEAGEAVLWKALFDGDSDGCRSLEPGQAMHTINVDWEAEEVTVEFEVGADVA
jgi:hypothetical protein